MPAYVHAIINGTGACQTNVATVINAASGSPTNESDSGNNSLGTGGSTPAII
jgi:hypothetical protein